MLFNHLCGSSLDSLQAPSVPRRLWNPELSDDLSPFHLLSCGGSYGFGLSCDLDCTQLGVNMFHASGASLLIAISYRMRYIMFGCSPVCFLACFVRSSHDHQGERSRGSYVPWTCLGMTIPFLILIWHMKVKGHPFCLEALDTGSIQSNNCQLWLCFLFVFEFFERKLIFSSKHLPTYCQNRNESSCFLFSTDIWMGVTPPKPLISPWITYLYTKADSWTCGKTQHTPRSSFYWFSAKN